MLLGYYVAADLGACEISQTIGSYGLSPIKPDMLQAITEFCQDYEVPLESVQ